MILRFPTFNKIERHEKINSKVYYFILHTTYNKMFKHN